jgi:ABC-2 type transport system ATP-binding protein
MYLLTLCYNLQKYIIFSFGISNFFICNFLFFISCLRFLICFLYSGAFMDEVIILDRVSKQLAKKEILKDVSFTVKRGDIFGYLGPNGAGKTTTIRIILGLMAASSGLATILERKVEEDKIRQKVGFILESDGLYENISAFDNLLYFARLYEVPEPAGPINRALELVGLRDRAKDKAGTYSKGMRQRLALARAMVHDPEIFILDEPTAGVDPSGQIEIRRIMLDMVKNQGKTILLSSHNLDEVQRICNRIALIHKGRIRLYGELDKLQKEMSRGEVIIETEEAIPESILVELKSPGVTQLNQQDKVLRLVIGNEMPVSGVVTLLAARGVKIEQVKKPEASLEEMYTTILRDAESS